MIVDLTPAQVHALRDACCILDQVATLSVGENEESRWVRLHCMNLSWHLSNILKTQGEEGANDALASIG